MSFLMYTRKIPSIPQIEKSEIMWRISSTTKGGIPYLITCFMLTINNIFKNKWIFK